MPVPAKFSKEFYDKLGHRVADELVEWFKGVDTTYRTEFRDLFDLRFNQLDAKLEQRTAEVRQEMAVMKGELRGEMAALRQSMAEMRSDLHGQMGGIRESMAKQEARLIRWGLALWVTSLGVITAVIRFSG